MKGWLRKRGGARESVESAESGGWALQSSGAAANGVTVLRRAGWVLLLSGPVLGGCALALLLQGAAVPAPAAAVAKKPAAAAGSAVGPGGFAELFVRFYVEAGRGSEASLTPFLPSVRDLSLSAEPGTQSADQVAAVEVREVSAGYWAVTVAARIQAAPGTEKRTKSGEDGEESDGAGTLRYFQVPVRKVGGGSLVAAALPAEVGAPVVDEGPELGYGNAVPPGGGDEAGRTLREFFAAYLAGSGELDRYLSPRTRLAAVSPAPYAEVSVETVAERGTDEPGSDYPAGSTVPDGAERQLLVHLTARDSAGAERPLTYAIALKARDGRWETDAVQAAPALAAQGEGNDGE